METVPSSRTDLGFRDPTLGYVASVYGEDSGTMNASSLIPDAELTRFSRGLLTFAAIMTVLIMIAGIIGNLLTIVALLRCPRVRNVAAAFIISLCVADFIFCLLTLPFSSSRFIHGGWVHGDVLCTMFPFMRYGNVGVSLLSIAMITINRYIMIAHYNVYNRIYRPCYIAAMICFCWCLSYGMQLPTLFGVWGKFGLHKKLGTCTIISDENGRSSKTALFIIAFVIPCIVIVCCYARIFWVVHSSEVRMRKHAINRPEANPNHFVNPAAKKKEEKALKAKRNEWRITQMVLAIFLSYVACYLPITIVKVADDEVMYPGFHVLGYILLYFSACVNPIIYVIMNKQYRQAYKTVLLCRRPRLLSSTPANLSSYAAATQNHVARVGSGGNGTGYHGITGRKILRGSPTSTAGGGRWKPLPGGPLQTTDKSRDGPSKTMVSQVSFALNPIGRAGAGDLDNNVFGDNEKL